MAVRDAQKAIPDIIIISLVLRTSSSRSSSAGLVFLAEDRITDLGSGCVSVKEESVCC